MSNRGFELFLEQRSKKLIRARVGDKYVAELLESQNLLIGGEPSGHVILRDYLSTGDGLFCALRVAHAAQLTGNWLLNSFVKFPQVSANLIVKERKDLTSQPIAQMIAQAESTIGQGRLVIRYSGTEPLLRIMVEAPDYELAARSARALSEQLATVL
jgi:phosphoglucosamine mutase